MRLLAVTLLLLLVPSHAHADTTERDGIDALAGSLVSEDTMEALAATLADPAVSPACRAYADLLLLVGTYVRHLLAYPESRVAPLELTTRVTPSLPASQYACEIAA